MHSSETSPGNRHSNGLHGGLHPNLSTSSYASTSQPQLQAAPMNNNSDVFAASRGTDPLSSSHSQILQSRNSTHTPSQRGSRRRMREAVSFAEMPPKYSFQFPNTSTTHELSYGSPKQLHGPGFSDANPLRLHDTHTAHDHSTTGSGFPHGSASVTFANEAAMRHSMQPMMPSLIDSGGQSITHTSRGLDASAASSSTDAPSSASDLRTTTFSIPLNLAVLLNILITVGLVAMISTVPLSSVSNRSMERVTTTLSSYLANTLVQAMYANILFVPLVVKAYASGWLVSNTQASWKWTSADMLEAMRQMCVFNQWSSNTPLLYISMSSPITGYGAYCSAQYSSNFLVGQYTADNESDYRYLIDPFTGEYIQPLEPFLPVERMSAYDYTVTFGGDGNVWHNVVEPWFHSQNVNGPCSNCNSWWVWTEGQVSALTYNIPFVDYAGNPGVISAGLQPFTLTAVFPSGQSVMEAIGSAAVVDPKTGMVLVNSWGENAPTMLDNWNASAVGGFEIPTGLYMGDIHDALMSDTFSKLGGKAGLQAVALDVMQWSVHFQSAGSPAYAVVSRIALGDDVPINYLVIYAIRRDQYANDVTTVEHAVIACVTIIIFVIAAVDMILIYLFLHPLRGVAKGLRDTAQLRDGSGHIEGRFSIIREVAQMQYHFTVMNGQLLRMKAFLPQGVLGGGEIWSGSENEDGDLDPNMMGGQDELDYLHLNERALLDEENKLKRRYCSVLLICLHMKESEHAIVSQLCAQFMEGVIPHVLRHGGVIENQRPDVIFASFGSQNKLAIHQMRAAKCALEIFTQAHIQGKIASRLACFLDAGEYFIGTCGAMQRNARVTFGLRLPSHPEILKLSKVLRAQILSSQRFANSIDEDVLSMPVDCIVGTLTKRVVVIYEVRGSVKSLPETVNADEIRQMLKAARLAFSKMLTGDYTGALAFVEPYERRDPQVARIIRTCRTQIKKGCTEPYHRYIGRIRFSEDNVNYDSSAQAAALANNMDMGVSVLYKSMRLNPTNDTDPLSRFPQRQASSVKPHDPPPSDSAIGESKDDDEENTALFEMFIEDDDSDNDPGFSTSSLHGGGGSATQVAASVAVGELPIVFEDIEGTTWTRSVDRLGTGAFSDVYRGLSTSGNLVALKCIRLRAKNIEYNDIISEVRLFSSLHHENIVQYISVYVSTAHLIEIMEFVPGGSLDSLLTSFGKFSDAIVRRFLRDILRGLRYLHSKSIAHCDIKPHNVLLAMDGQCKISDFGSALSRATADEQKNDDELDLRGTPGYVAPEVARGDVPTMKSDIFSIGVTVLELLTGHLPWKYTTDEPTPPPNAVTSPTQFAPVSAAVTHEGRRESMPTGVSPLMGDLLDLHNGSFGGGDATGEKSPAKANGAGAGGVPNFSEMPQRRPIENVLRDATQLIRCIGNGSVFPYIPEDLEATVTDFLKKCLNPNPEVRATTEELLLHPWLA